LAEVLGALSVATDVGMGQPPGHAVGTCLLAMGVADALGLSARERTEVYYVSLLRYVGCTADAAEVARFAGDEIALAATVAPHVMGDPEDEDRAVGLGGVGRAKARSMRAHCEAAGMLAARLGLGEDVERALRHGFERWDGAGHPGGLAGESIPIGTRLAILARDVELWHRLGGVDAVHAMLRDRRGRAYDPTAVDAVLDVGGQLLEQLPGDPWQQLLDAEPSRSDIPQERLDPLLEVLADFADAKLPYALGHSRAVAAIAERAARELGLDDGAVVTVRRAALVHDLGRTGVSNRIWDRPGRLSADDWERVRLHPYLTERILVRASVLEPLAWVAGAHHERLDGSGYHRGVDARGLNAPARVLAAADGYQSRLQDRPHRPRRTAQAAAAELADEARRGELDARATSAVAAVGHVRIRLAAGWPAGLTDREVDVLRLACRGLTREDVGQRLGISAKTVSRHLENSYGKIGVSTRAGAALFAVQHGLLTDHE
jgi:HD-GYP domain-containing protein (c-di-GMP phosphodiesterase class II)